MRDSELEKAKEAAYRFLSYRARSVFEVKRQLIKKGFEETTIDEVIERLKELQFLDDDLFAEKMAKELVKIKCLGPFAVVDKLRKKGINSEKAAKVIDDLFLEVDERETAKALVLKKKKGTSDSVAEKGRLSRYLHSKGYGWETIHTVLQEINDRERD